ncbi:hypothetical protein [Streptomyces pseudovenezuelae]|uniref:Uncharacterized protein n=1 Tax=Streptomyces pseudovenezuelae TaxID=67350 RepID=A0ABT6LDH1_9ACTN|nr:hypothetical protein [Streptomyces pseudovenezuelae]MDH6214356.1 hypothetical protein [Streptomyces pseudovenezuelae]
MSRPGWAFVNAGSGPGHLQRVPSNAQFTRVQRAYRAYIDHSRDCPNCAFDTTSCDVAEELWRTYVAANS